MSENGKYVPGSLFFYAPNKGAPVFFAVCFLVSGLTHVYQCIRYKCWKVTGMYTTVGALFVTGFIMREWCTFNFDRLIPYILSICFVYAGPPLYELGNYMVLSRILYYIPYYSPIHPGRVITTFAALSGVVESLSGCGASLSTNTSNPPHLQTTGKSLMKAALVLQLAFMVAFIILAVFFQLRCKRAGIFPPKLKAVLTTLYLSCALITIRTIYRTVEFFAVIHIHYNPKVDTAFDPMTISPIIRYEWFFYVFEASLMLVNSVLINARHPMRFLPRNNKIYLAEDGVTEIEGPGYEDRRKFWVTLVDPFDFVGILKGRNKQERFWETHERGAGAGEATVANETGEGVKIGGRVAAAES